MSGLRFIRPSDFDSVRFNSRGARTSFRFVDSLVASFDLPLRPLDKGNVIRSADLFPHLAHHEKERRWDHSEVVTHLPVRSSSGESPQHD